MNSFIESLESRTLLSVAPSVAQLGAEGKVVAADLVAFRNAGKAGFKLIITDLKAAGELKSSKALVKTLAAEGLAAFGVTKRGVNATISLIKSDVKKLEADAHALAKHPTNLTLQANVTAAGNTLTLDASNRLTLVTADVTAEQTTDSANLTDIKTANPGNTQLATDAKTIIGPNSAAARTALTGALTTALTTDVAAVVAAFPG